ncbi:MAG: 54S ribosomal protein L4 mitochondrial [Pleopsidium flavum]|nr:MAG: 54S ribosomal protein L4 mitochondrial [Pleopsidium flavum]KAI9871297.1 MAG: 54S ribosomal protein L4 mitochondrial [Pleopsidium flavum]
MSTPHQKVRRTQRAIKHALTERYYAWEDARKVAQTDPEVDLESITGPAYVSQDFEEDAEVNEGQERAHEIEGEEKPTKNDPAAAVVL